MTSAVVVIHSGQVATESDWYVAKAISGIKKEEREVVKVLASPGFNRAFAVYSPA